MRQCAYEGSALSRRKTQVSASGKQALGKAGSLCTEPHHPSYHGFIVVAPTLELQTPIGVCWVALGVFADGPFPGLSVHLLALLPCCAGSPARQWRDVLVDELPTATPGRRASQTVQQHSPSPPISEYKPACTDELGLTRATRILVIGFMRDRSDPGHFCAQKATPHFSYSRLFTTHWMAVLSH